MAVVLLHSTYITLDIIFMVVDVFIVPQLMGSLFSRSSSMNSFSGRALLWMSRKGNGVTQNYDILRSLPPRPDVSGSTLHRKPYLLPRLIVNQTGVWSPWKERAVDDGHGFNPRLFITIAREEDVPMNNQYQKRNR